MHVFLLADDISSQTVASRSTTLFTVWRPFPTFGDSSGTELPFPVDQRWAAAADCCSPLLPAHLPPPPLVGGVPTSIPSSPPSPVPGLPDPAAATALLTSEFIPRIKRVRTKHRALCVGRRAAAGGGGGRRRRLGCRFRSEWWPAVAAWSPLTAPPLQSPQGAFLFHNMAARRWSCGILINARFRAMFRRLCVCTSVVRLCVCVFGVCVIVRLCNCASVRYVLRFCAVVPVCICASSAVRVCVWRLGGRAVRVSRSGDGSASRRCRPDPSVE